MKNRNLPKYKPTSKSIIGYCLRDRSHPIKKKRRDAKFCLGKCRKRYELDRKENEFIKHVFKGTKEELDQYFHDLKARLETVVQ